MRAGVRILQGVFFLLFLFFFFISNPEPFLEPFLFSVFLFGLNNTDFYIILPFIAIRGTPAEVSNAPVVRSSFFNTLK